METSRYTLPLILLSIAFLLLPLSAQMTGNFKCGSPGSPNTTCRSLVGYSTKNATTYANIQTLFAVESLRSILEANNLPPSTAPAQRVNPNQLVRVPIPCTCSNGTGVSSGVPVYTIKRGDTLSGIASELFGGLVSFQRISELNRIPNPNEIDAGQRVWIPLPCSCDRVNGRDVVHYAHVVKSGSSLGTIAAQFGTDNGTLATLNGISGDAELLADLPLDVPLRACSSSVRNNSLDASSMLLPNGSYSITANNCIRCSCEASKNWTLSCEASQLRPTTWPTCPPTRCPGAENLLLGNTTSTSCGPRSCAYAGYSNQTILTTLSPDPCSGSDGSTPSGNYASTFSPSFSFVVVLIQCALFCVCLL